LNQKNNWFLRAIGADEGKPAGERFFQKDVYSYSNVRNTDKGTKSHLMATDEPSSASSI